MATVIIAEPVVSNNELLDIIENLKRDNDLLKKEHEELKERLTKKRVLLSKLTNENTNLTKNSDLFLRKIIKNNSLIDTTDSRLLIEDNELHKNYIMNDQIDKISLNGSTILEFVLKYDNSKIKIIRKRDKRGKFITKGKVFQEVNILKYIFSKEDSNGAFREYLNMIKLKNYQIFMWILLQNKETIFFCSHYI